MSASTWFALSLLVLAAGVALLGIAGWVRSHREQRTSATLKTALQPRDEARDTEAARRDSLGWLERFGRALSGGRLESALLANEDRLLLDLAGWNTRRGTAIYLGLRLLLGVLVGEELGVDVGASEASQAHLKLSSSLSFHTPFPGYMCTYSSVFDCNPLGSPPPQLKNEE